PPPPHLSSHCHLLPISPPTATSSPSLLPATSSRLSFHFTSSPTLLTLPRLLSAIFSLHSALFLSASLSWVTLMGWDGNTFSESCSDRHRGARHFPLPGGTVTILAPTHTHTHTHTNTPPPHRAS